MNMKKVIISLGLIICALLNCHGQEIGKKFGINATINYGLLGDGDFGAIYYDNNLSYSLNQFFDITGSLGFLISSNNGIDNVMLSHTDAYLMGDFLIRITPIEGKKSILFFWTWLFKQISF